MRPIYPTIFVCALALLASPSIQPAPLAAAPAAGSPTIDGCPLLPADNIWNAPVDTAPLDAKSAAYITSIGAGSLKADFGSGLYNGGPIGIPFVSVPQNQATVPINFTAYGDESDAGPFPVPITAPIEGGAQGTGDRHVLVLQRGSCKLYELYRAFPQSNGSWDADAAALYDLNANTLRTAGWTSADAAGLPVLPGLARYDEVAAGAINHALRFTVVKTRKAYVWPARHFASSSTDPNLPPMGQRFRLKASVDISSFPHDTQVILTALKKYGMIIADNGSNWFVSGAPDERWDNDVLQQLRTIKGDQFEAVDVSGLQVSADSGQVKGEAGTTPTSTPTTPTSTTPTPITPTSITPTSITPTPTTSLSTRVFLPLALR